MEQLISDRLNRLAVQPDQTPLQVLCVSATTTEAVCRSIQHGQATLRDWAQGFGVNPKTITQWSNCSFIADKPTGPNAPGSAVLPVAQEAPITAFRRRTLLTVDAWGRHCMRGRRHFSPGMPPTPLGNGAAAHAADQTRNRCGLHGRQELAANHSIGFGRDLASRPLITQGPRPVWHRRDCSFVWNHALASAHWIRAGTAARSGLLARRRGAADLSRRGWNARHLV